MVARAPAHQRAGGTARAENLEDVLALLHAQGDRVTTPRRLLIQSLLEAGGHRTAEKLAAVVQSRAPDVHLSTIYRNLDELERLGVIEQVRFGQGAATYHLAAARHGHLVCSECGATIEVSDGLFHSLERAAMTRYGFTIDPHHLAMLGRCATCSAAEHSQGA
jgi:Fe2+ or Zn2+ uptake regulation protein